ncbi:MAG: IS3 family transposase [Gemmatimonas sp.]
MQRKAKGSKAGPIGRRERRTFTAEHKADAVRMMHERRATGVSVAQEARELDIRAEQLRRWAQEANADRAAVSSVPGETLEQENRRLRREDEMLRQEQAFAKKSGGVLRERVAMRYAVITRHRHEFAVRLMCRVLNVTPSGYYASLTRPESWRAMMDDVLMAHVRVAHAESHDRYGAPRVHKELTAQGWPTSRKRVARLMRQEGLVARSPKKRRITTTDSHHADPIAPNLLARHFDVSAETDRVSVSDMTYLPTREGTLYLATVLDLGSRRCVGWAMQDSMEVSLVMRALSMAIISRRPASGLIHHSDRGSQPEFSQSSQQGDLKEIVIAC